MYGLYKQEDQKNLLGLSKEVVCEVSREEYDSSMFKQPSSLHNT